MYERIPENPECDGKIRWDPPNESAAEKVINDHPELPTLPDQSNAPIDLSERIGGPDEQMRVAQEVIERYNELTQ